MSNLRRTFRLVIDGHEHTIVTSARDMAAVEISAAEADANIANAGQVLKLLHAACLRLQLPGIPPDWETFADQLDDMDDLTDRVNGTLVDTPTPATV